MEKSKIASVNKTNIDRGHSFQAWGLWKDDRAHELMDPVIKQDEVLLPMLIRYINVALLCVQKNLLLQTVKT